MFEHVERVKASEAYQQTLERAWDKWWGDRPYGSLITPLPIGDVKSLVTTVADAVLAYTRSSGVAEEREALTPEQKATLEKATVAYANNLPNGKETLSYLDFEEGFRAALAASPIPVEPEARVTALCGACGREVKLTEEGRFWNHWRGDEPPCPGSTHRPEDVVGDVYERNSAAVEPEEAEEGLAAQ